MAKLILLIAAVLIAYLLLRNYRRRIDKTEKQARRADETMVRCEQCGVHLPRSESLLSAGKFYCSAEHERAHRGG
ncbi:MAG: PP0621 family protein [Rhodospirillaceae bacterium]